VVLQRSTVSDQLVYELSRIADASIASQIARGPLHRGPKQGRRGINRRRIPLSMFGR